MVQCRDLSKRATSGLMHRTKLLKVTAVPLASAPCGEGGQPGAGGAESGEAPGQEIIGRIERGFDFLGYHFSPAGLTVVSKTIAILIEKASRLYEQKCRARLARAALELKFLHRGDALARDARTGMQAKGTNAARTLDSTQDE
jgi:hypothetical protein